MTTEVKFFEWVEEENGKEINCSTGNPLVRKRLHEGNSISYVIIQNITEGCCIEVCSTRRESQAHQLLKLLRERIVDQNRPYINLDLSYHTLFNEVHYAPFIS